MTPKKLTEGECKMRTREEITAALRDINEQGIGKGEASKTATKKTLEWVLLQREDINGGAAK